MARQIRLLGEYDQKAVSRANAVHAEEDPTCVVQQQFRDEVDANTIVARYGLATVASMPSRGAMFGDFTGIFDFESAADRVEAARSAFQALPAAARERFGNDVRRFVQEGPSLPEAEWAALAAPPVSEAPPKAAAPAAPPVAPAPAAPADGA